MVSCLHPDFCAFLNEWNAFVPVPRFAAKPAEQPEAKQAPETEKPAERGNAPWPPRVEGNKYSGARGRTDGRKVVGFFAKKDDQLNFAVPLMDYLEEQGYAVRPVGTEDIHRHGLEKLMRQVDVAWFEWGEGHVVEASRLRKVCPIICRVHRYEVFSPRMQEVNWKNVDDAVFVNESFVDAFRLVCGIDLRRETRIHGIPNPANEDLPFKERSPGYGIAHVSRFNPDKNPALMLQVLSELVRRDRRYQLHMVGAVQDQQLYMYCMDYVRKAGLEENFHYHGVIGDVPAFLADKSHILSTSIVESQGMGIIEAMLQGLKPVLHRGFAMDRNYPGEYLFGTAGEAADMIASKEFDSHEYRREALRRFSREKVLGEIKLLVDSLAASREKRPAGSVAKTASRKDSLLNLARFYESRGDSKRHEEYMRMAENC
jgi:glycosyltransferase involved in cell wall biosynthesis